jgi:hypothetical protein
LAIICGKKIDRNTNPAERHKTAELMIRLALTLPRSPERMDAEDTRTHLPGSREGPRERKSYVAAAFSKAIFNLPRARRPVQLVSNEKEFPTLFRPI